MRVILLCGANIAPNMCICIPICVGAIMKSFRMSVVSRAVVPDCSPGMSIAMNRYESITSLALCACSPMTPMGAWLSGRDFGASAVVKVIIEKQRKMMRIGNFKKFSLYFGSECVNRCESCGEHCRVDPETHAHKDRKNNRSEYPREGENNGPFWHD